MNQITNNNLCPITYDAIKAAIVATYSDPFHMTIKCQDEWSAIAAAVNQGIDSHLEAITDAPAEFDNDTGTCEVTPDNLCVLLRRLADANEAAMYLQSDILTVLGFDDSGTYVGREALGLE